MFYFRGPRFRKTLSVVKKPYKLLPLKLKKNL